MGSWGYKVDESDTFADVYDQFFDEYNNGATPEVATASVRTELGDYFVEYDDQYDAHFALALAQWETQSLEQSSLRQVEQYIESGADLRNWEERGSDPNTLKKRAASLSSFLSKLRTPRPSKKRRRRPKFDSQNLKISIPKTIEQELRSDGLFSLERAYFCGDEVKLHCEFV